MCGICGIIKKNDVIHEDRKLIEQMNQIQKHRGPDDGGIFVDRNMILGHRRLAIFDLSAAGHQPMTYMNKYVISYNGEIYNYCELKKELEEEGYQFSSNTDTEVIMAAYDKWGMECLQKFNGFWAFALLEKDNQRLILSRDRFGVKPLYYCVRNESILFASEIKALLEDKHIERLANEKVIKDFLINGLVDFSEETFFKGIYKVPAGCNMIIDPGLTYKLQKFYSVRFSDSVDGKISAKEIERFKELFTEAVDLRLRADVPVGSCLSGGLDSSSIVCQANSLLKRKGKARTQETFSACYKNFVLDERKYIDEVVKETGVKANYVYPNSKMLLHDLENVIYYQDEPFGTMSIYASYCVMRMARERGIIVLLDGQGADEILCGYRKSRIYYIKKLISKKKILIAAKEFLYSLSQFRVTESRQNDISKIMQILLKNRKIGREELFLSKDLMRRDLLFKYNSSANFMETDFYKISLPALLRFADRNSMAFSIEDRLPFLDVSFVDFVSKLPLTTKIYKGYSKYIMRKALDMPQNIKKRKDKIGFSTPDMVWIKENEKYFFDVFARENFRAKKFIDNKRVIEQWNEIMSGKIKIELFRYICLELWMEKFCVK